MLNIISLLRSVEIWQRRNYSSDCRLSADNFELPFNTPDLDWYVDAYNSGDISSGALMQIVCQLLTVLCLVWTILGRHINLRPDDYYSLQRMMPTR